MSDSRHPAIVISNSYGTPNLGDEAILHAMCGYYLKEELSVTVLSNCNEPPTRELPEHVTHAAGGPRDTISAFKAIKCADLLLIGGGGIIQSSTSLGNLIFHLSRAWMALATGTPFAFVGIGAGPIPHTIGRALTRWTLNAARYIGVRDQASRSYLRDIGVTAAVATGADLAFAISQHQPTEKRTDDALRIGLSLRPAVGDKRKRHDFQQAMALGELALDAIAAAASSLDKPCRVSFLSFNDEQDLIIGRKLVEKNDRTLNIDLRDATDTPEQRLAFLANLDCVIGMRLHSIILSAVATTPAIGIPYDTKVSETCNALGLGDLVLPIRPNQDEIIANLLALLGALDQRRDEIAARTQSLRADARQMMATATAM
ncbi:MAG: polysaccharide pyruvyl transferase family protein [Deltaproteobacteria bacterium]|jgi:polysaccharide pyruvyl transferase CsaB|nr:polysaccharide pyruvyl transferase family protein [Deltaproteobacteria bacterium]